MEVDLQSTETDVPAGEPPTPPRRCLPFIILSSTSSASSTLYVIRSPFPLSEDGLAEQRVQYELGTRHPNCPITPHYSYVTSNKYPRVPAPLSQSHSTPMTFGTILTSPTVPTSPQTNEPVPPITEPLPPPQTTIPASPSGINPYRTESSHLSLYQSSPSQSLDHPTNPHGKKSLSGTNIPEHKSLDLGRQQGEDQAGQTGQTPPQRYSLRRSMSMESMERAPLHPASYRSNPSPRQLPSLPVMMLADAIHLFRAVNMTQPPDVLLHADYYDLFSYFAYELLSSLAWASTDTRIDYFYLSLLHVNVDSILQRESS